MKQAENLFDADEFAVECRPTRTTLWYWICQEKPLFKRTMHMGHGEERNPAWYEWHWARGRDPEKERRPLPAKLRAAVIERDGYVCRLCGLEVEPHDVHIDHILPFSHGGLDTLDNLQVSHGACNLSKGARV